jgi:N-formylglutamate amidohydrolase
VRGNKNGAHGPFTEQRQAMVNDDERLSDDNSGVEVIKPSIRSAPVVFASPHSGRCYPKDFIHRSRLDELKLRRSEDAFIDEVFSSAPDFGAVFLQAHFPRAYVDANRRAWELDPLMFKDDLPEHVVRRSPRITAGLGTIPKIVANGEPIYNHLLTYDEARKRIEKHHFPYHQTLNELISDTVDLFEGCLLVDCHSMPSSGLNARDRLSDIVIGDLQGKSCSREIIDFVIERLKDFGYSVALNTPYAGGYTTRHYGIPDQGVHTFQIEINRALYMDEKLITREPGLVDLISNMQSMIKMLTAIDPKLLAPTNLQLAKAAE